MNKCQLTEKCLCSLLALFRCISMNMSLLNENQFTNFVSSLNEHNGSTDALFLGSICELAPLSIKYLIYMQKS